MELDKAIDAISGMLRAKPGRYFPATILYEEGWMLRLVVNWFATHRGADHTLAFDDDCIWYSEARLASPFLPRYRGDRHGESHTQADAVIGHIKIGEHGNKAELSLQNGAKVFKVIEAKMFSGLSKGVTNARDYNQAARTVACMAELMRQSSCDPTQMDLAFYVLAPCEQINNHTFDEFMNLEDIERVVRKRCQDHDEPKKIDWFDESFRPVWEHIKVRCLSWEEILATIRASNDDPGLSAFYEECLKFNRPAKQ